MKLSLRKIENMPGAVVVTQKNSPSVTDLTKVQALNLWYSKLKKLALTISVAVSKQLMHRYAMEPIINFRNINHEITILEFNSRSITAAYENHLCNCT